jgi:hypothetical protein
LEVIASAVAIQEFSPTFNRIIPGGQQVWVEIVYDAVLLLVALSVTFFVIRGLTMRVVSSTASRLPGLGQSEASQIRQLLALDRPTPMGGRLAGREISVFISGHTHAPSLTEVARDGTLAAVAVNSGCWLRQLWPVHAHGGAPPVFLSTYVLTHVRIYLAGAGIQVELWEHPKPAPRRLRFAERIATLGRLPALPPANAAPRIIAATEVTNPASPRSAKRPD